MPTTRAFSVLRTQDQWLRATHAGTTLDPLNGTIELAWRPEPPPAADPQTKPLATGAAFDAQCRLYRSVLDAGRIERLSWRALDPLRPPAEAPAPVDLLGRAPPSALGEFLGEAAPPPVPRAPRGLAIDAHDRLYIADAGEIVIVDLHGPRILRRIRLAAAGKTSPRALDLLVRGATLYATLDAPGTFGARLVKLSLRSEPVPVERKWIEAPSRLALTREGELLVLEHAGTQDARVSYLDRPTDAHAIPWAADIDFDGEGALVVAFGPGETLRRFSLGKGTLAELPYLVARGYDGLGIVRTPDGQIGFFSENHFRVAVPARLRRERSGRVITYRFDSGEFQTTWGRLFVDACVPAGSAIHVRCVATDEPPEEPTVAWSPPKNITSLTLLRPDRTPPLPPMSFAPLLETEGEGQPLHRREDGPELPWVRPEADDPFETYEAPVLAPAGRYLWLSLELTGNTRSTPKIRGLRVEHQAHDLLQRLPRAFSRDEGAASFLQRYLGMLEGQLGDLDGRATSRHVLLDPRTTPPEALPWLASFMGLALDGRWSTEVRRTLIEEAVWLFRFRGTAAGLSRLMEICVGVKPALVEHFRLRGNVAALGEGAAPSAASAVVGVSFRVGGALHEDDAPVVSAATKDAFRTHAHRFSVVIPASLNEDELDMVRDLLELHRPAHTIVDICTIDAGMRVGRRLLVGITSIIGRSAGFETLAVGRTPIGTASVLGRPRAETQVGVTSIGRGSRIG